MPKLHSVSAFGQIGGSCKSTLIQAVEAGLVLSDRKVCIIDADPANAGYTEATHDSNSVNLRALALEDRVSEYVQDAATAGSPLLIDCGAGAMSMDANFVLSLSDVYAELGKAGYLHVTVLPINSNKAVSERVTRESIRDICLMAKL